MGTDWSFRLSKPVLSSRESIICLARVVGILINWFRFPTGITISQSTYLVPYKDFWLKFLPSSLCRAKRRCHSWRLETRILCAELWQDKLFLKATGLFQAKRACTHCSLQPFGTPKLHSAIVKARTVSSSQSNLCCKYLPLEWQSSFQYSCRFSIGSSESWATRSR